MKPMDWIDRAKSFLSSAIINYNSDNIYVAALITLMYTYSRYPEAPIQISKERVKVFIDVAKRAIEFAKQALEKEP